MADVSKLKGFDNALYDVKDATARSALSDKASLASPTFTGTPKAPTAAAGTNTTQIATTAFVMNAFQANDAMIFKGTIGTGGNVTALPATHYQGWTYKVITAGSYAGQNCEIGDMIICITDGTSANNAHWTVVQSNIDGAVIGPASSTDAHIAVFDGTTGKLVKDSGFTIATSVPSGAKFTDTNTKNTAGSTDTSSKIFLIGATSQAANPQTYSHDTAYVGTDGCLYSGSEKVLTAHQDISGKKDVQTAVSDPTASGNATAFIDTISQNTQGVVTVTKKSVPVMTAASSSAAGAAGLVPAPAKGDQAKFLRGDKTWQTVITSHQDISGKKNTQSAVGDPTASGNSLTFIDSITQNAQGVITPTKKTVSDMGAASSSAAGTHGLVPAPAKGAQGKFLRGDGTWQTALTSHQDISGKVSKSGDTMTGMLTLQKALHPVVTGTGTAGQAGSSTVAYIPSLWTFNLGMTPVEGDVITIKIPVAGVNAGVWVSVDNGTNYYPVATNGTTLLTTHYAVNHIISLVYQSGMATSMRGNSISGAAANASASNVTMDRWCVLNFYDSNTTYSNASLGQGYGTCSTAAATAAKVVSLSSYALTTGGIVSVKFSYDVPANATMNINSKGAKAIYYRGSAIPAGIIKAGDIATFIYSSYYHLISIDSSTKAVDTSIAANSTSTNLPTSAAVASLVSSSKASVSYDSTTGTIAFTI